MTNVKKISAAFSALTLALALSACSDPPQPQASAPETASAPAAAPPSDAAVFTSAPTTPTTIVVPPAEPDALTKCADGVEKAAAIEGIGLGILCTGDLLLTGGLSGVCAGAVGLAVHTAPVVGVNACVTSAVTNSNNGATAGMLPASAVDGLVPVSP